MKLNFSRKVFFVAPVISIISVGLMILFMNTIKKNTNPFPQNKEPEIGSIPTDKIAVVEIKNNTRKITTVLNDHGFTPAVLVLEKNRETLWIIKVSKIRPEDHSIIFPVNNYKITLKNGTNEYKFTPVKNFIFRSGTGSFNGYGKVVDDRHKIDRRAIKKEAAAIKLPKGFGSCCWIQ